jgi:cephalosporin-C deacetylase-like acetyl esterase
MRILQIVDSEGVSVMSNQLKFVLLLAAVIGGRPAFSQDSTRAYQTFVQKQALKLRANDRSPATLDEWMQRKAKLRSDLESAFGGFPTQDCELDARILGEFQRDGYRVQKIIFQTRPGIWMTANAYVPDKPGKRPAVLHVHGHWTGAKQDPVVQSRCIGCAKLGFFVLSVDAFGAGERAIGKKLGEYHGEMTAATLLPVGFPLAGLQVYENKRAIDYLLTRPEVDARHIGITGASGGGNQTMYTGALDERLTCVVPTCSVGTYHSYLSAACGLCELVPGGLKITEEGDILGLAANRGLMVTSATKDAFQFSVAEAIKSVARAESIAQLFPAATVRHTIVESPHAYNQPMREAMYGWMTLHLKGEGDGSPIPDSFIQPEDPELLRCYPNSTRPDHFVTIPQFAEAEAKRLTEYRPASIDPAAWENERAMKIQGLVDLCGGLPKGYPLQLKAENDGNGITQFLTFDSEPDLTIVARRDFVKPPVRIAIVLDLDNGLEGAWSSFLATELRDDGWAIVAPELRATGRLAIPRDQIGQALDHNSAEWAIWIGRPLLGQWVVDVCRTLDAIDQLDGSLPSEILVAGHRSAGIVALCAAAVDQRITRVRTINSLSTYVTNHPYRDVRLGLMVPGILRKVGDIADIAALVAPRALRITGGTSGKGTQLSDVELSAQFATTRHVFNVLGAKDALVIEPSH